MRFPLSIRLSIVFGIVVVLVLVLLGWFLISRTEANLYAAVDQGLEARSAVVAGSIDHVSGGVIDENGNYIQPDDATAQVIEPSGKVVDSSNNVAGRVILTRQALDGVATSSSFTKRLPGFDDPFRFFVTRVNQQGPDGFIIVGENLGDTNDAIATLRHDYVVGALVSLIFVLLAGWWLVRSALRPVDRMRRQAARLSLGQPAEHLPVGKVDDELGRLARTLNTMLDRMRDSYERERRFIAFASHELRTPLGVLRTEIDLALSRERSPGELTDALISAGDEVDQLSRVADDLLTLSSTEQQGIPVLFTERPLVDFVEPACRSVRDRASAAGVTLRTQVSDVYVTLDVQLLTHALRNVLDNALPLSPSGSTVTVIGERLGDRVRFTVDDEGPGFPVAYLPFAFEPFSQAETSTEGSGLGLAIVDAVARVHGGSATVENRPGGGARVTIDVPDGAAATEEDPAELVDADVRR